MLKRKDHQPYQWGVSVAPWLLLPATEHEQSHSCPEMLFHPHHATSHFRGRIYRQIGKSLCLSRHPPVLADLEQDHKLKQPFDPLSRRPPTHIQNRGLQVAWSSPAER